MQKRNHQYLSILIGLFFPENIFRSHLVAGGNTVQQHARLIQVMGGHVTNS